MSPRRLAQTKPDNIPFPGCERSLKSLAANIPSHSAVFAGWLFLCPDSEGIHGGPSQGCDWAVEIIAKTKIMFANFREADYNYQSFHLFSHLNPRFPMVATFRFLAKAVAVFTLWALIGAVLYAVGNEFIDRQAEAVTAESDAIAALSLPAFGEMLVEADAVLVTTVTERPVDLEFDSEETGYVLDEKGLVFRIRQSGGRETMPWLVLPNEKTDSSVPFRALALHPGFLDSDSRGFGRFYTIEPEVAGAGLSDFSPEYGADGEHHQDVLVEYRTLDPRSRTFTGSRKVLARFSQPGPEHNVSDLAFDRIGRLFVAIGDGANVDPGRQAPSRNAMSLLNVYGKVLRIDPLGDNSANGKYGIPPRNPFLVIDQALPEIWCYGLRDPRRIEFDPYRDWLTIVDLGQDGIEEMNISENGGEHFGWDLCEGTYFYPPSRGRKSTEGVTAPRTEFASVGGDRIAGGFIYHGNHFPALRGRLMFASASGRLMSSRLGSQDDVISRLLVGNQRSLSTNAVTGIRPGPTGELFVLTSSGDIYELQKQNSAVRSKKAKRPMLCWAL